MIEYIYSGCVAIIVFIVLLILSKHKRVLSDYIFIGWLIVLFVNVISFLIIAKYNYPARIAERLLIEFSEASVFLHGPIFLFYTHSLTKPNYRMGTRKLLHILPFLGSGAVLVYFVLEGMEVAKTYRVILTITKMISLLVYSILVIRDVNSHARSIEKVFSNTEDKYLRWLSFLAWGIVTVWIAFAVGIALYSLNIDIPQFGGLIGNLALCLLIFLIGYFGVRQEPIFSFGTFTKESLNLKNGLMSNSELEMEANEVDSENGASSTADGITSDEVVKYRKSGLSNRRSLELVKRVEDFMEKEKPYRDPELTLFLLAERIQIHPNHLSQIINHFFHQNFFDFINEYRVAEIKKAIASGTHKHFTLLGIGMEFGFSSKASFNRAFKKSTGMTPTLHKKLSETGVDTGNVTPG